MILLDTHVLVWAFEKHPHLGSKTAGAIDAAAAGEGVGIPAIAVWEISMLTEKGRLGLATDVEEWITAAISTEGIQVVPLEPAVAIGSNRLPGVFHADPADRMIVATARHFNMALVTADKKILDYGARGYVRTIDASL